VADLPNDMTPDNTETTASQKRYHEQIKQEAYYRLLQQPWSQAEAIAKHYLSHASIAKDILEMVRMRGDQPDARLDETINQLTTIITNNHRADFGIELVWE